MAARAFYTVPAQRWDHGACGGDCIAVSYHGNNVCVLSPVNPHPLLDAIPGAQNLGARIGQLPTAFQAHFTRTLVERETDLGPIRLYVPTCDLTDDDVDCGEPLEPRVTFAGDDPAWYL